MGKSRSARRRWRGAIFREQEVPIDSESQVDVDLGPIVAEIYGGCMGLPQEVVDRIMGILQDDKKDLKACSLTCKSMFASTRHLIRQTLHVTREINQKILTPEEKRRYSRGDYRELELRTLSFMGERDLLKFVRHVNIRMELMFSPNVLGPHLQHFRSLDRVHTLTIHSFDALLWHEVHNTYFAQFYPTLTTLALIFPIDDYRFMPRFALQFPNLENLTIESLQPQVWPGTYSAITQSPPLRGHFRCVGVGQRDPGWLRELAFDLPNGINFRSVEFQDVHWEHGQHILDGCASSLEEFMFTVNVDRDGSFRQGHLQFRENSSLRSVVLRTPFSNLFGLSTALGLTSLSTITSLALSEFALELAGPPFEFTEPSINLWGNWDEIDKLFNSFLDRCPDFKLVIRRSRISDRDEFQAQAKERFPLMAERNCIQFEMSSAVDEYWGGGRL